MKPFLQKVPLGAKAIAYIRGRLETGLTLSTLLLSSQDLDRGEIFTFLPPGLSDKETEDFSHGGKLPEPLPSEWRVRRGAVMKPIPSAIDELAAMIQVFLSDAGRHPVCLLENFPAKRGDPFLARLASKTVFYDQEVYHVLGPSSSAKERIMQTIREAESLPTFVGALAALRPELSLDVDAIETLSRRELSSVARSAETIVVGAYDGESYLVWCSRK